MLAEIANAANDVAAIEKTLRLLQAFVQIAAGLAYRIEDAKLWTSARANFALARRYLRLFWWIGCIESTKREWKNNQDSFRRILSASKFALLAFYFFMEMCCITNAMQLTTSTFLISLQHHALQVWFVAICISILLTSYDFLFPTPTTNQKALYTQFVLDACDLTIPGSAVGWINADSVKVGVASSISSMIAGYAIWTRVQREAEERAVRDRNSGGMKVNGTSKVLKSGGEVREEKANGKMNSVRKEKKTNKTM